MKITLDLEKSQLDALLQCIETTFNSTGRTKGIRGLDMLAEARANHPSDFSYDVEMLGSVYGKLLSHWKGASKSLQMTKAGAQVRWGRKFLIESVLAKATAAAMG